jgi:hypothetical protein
MARTRHYESRVTYRDNYVTHRTVKSRSYGGPYATPRDKAAAWIFGIAAVLLLLPGGALGWYSIPIYSAYFVILLVVLDRRNKRRKAPYGSKPHQPECGATDSRSDQKSERPRT